ncbi:MAG: EF-hand domain-containing protein [Azonexus sp.]|nr:EF-hand domain-containing protein [Azonexus sp.]MDZ4317092.1 EF-hand domain-containing protein [Azonexus sp.]
MLSGINQASQMASQLFSRLDTKSQGYIEKTDLASAFSQISTQTGSSPSVDDVFSALDGDSDGKVTKDEFASVLAQLQEQMDSQRMQGAHGGPPGAGGMPPPPPPGNDAGFTKEELSSQLESAESSDTQRNSLLTKIVENFEAADSDGDGKVSFSEAMAYDESTKTATTSDSSSSTTASNSDDQIMFKIMQLMHAYGGGQDQEQSGLASLLSVSA